MADVLLLFVKENAALADALADLFDDAGFSICDGEIDDAALQSAAAVVALVSPAAVQCRTFRAKAHQAFASGNAVAARLDVVGWEGPSYDLGAWFGEPDDPVVDPLFFAVDRKVSAARRAAERAQPVRVVAFAQPEEEAPSAAPTSTTFDNAWRAALNEHPSADLSVEAPATDVPYWKVEERKPRLGALQALALSLLIGGAALTASLSFGGHAQPNSFTTPAAASDLGATVQQASYTPAPSQPLPALPTASHAAPVAAPAPQPLAAQAIAETLPAPLALLPENFLDPKQLEAAEVSAAPASAPRAKKHSST